MGWSPQSSASSPPPEDSESVACAAPNSDNTEVLPLHDLIAQFSLEAVNKNRASMQPAKLDFLNRAHIRMKLEDRREGGGRADLAKRARKILVDKWPQLAEETPALVTEAYVIRVVEALKVRLRWLFEPARSPQFRRIGYTNCSTSPPSAPTSSSRPTTRPLSQSSYIRACRPKSTVRPAIDSRSQPG